MGTVTMDTFRGQKNQTRDELVLHKMVPRSHSLSQLLNVDRTLDRLMTEGCGLIDSFMIYQTLKLWCGVTNFVIIELGCFELINRGVYCHTK